MCGEMKTWAPPNVKCHSNLDLEGTREVEALRTRPSAVCGASRESGREQSHPAGTGFTASMHSRHQAVRHAGCMVSHRRRRAGRRISIPVAPAHPFFARSGRRNPRSVRFLVHFRYIAPTRSSLMIWPNIAHLSLQASLEATSCPGSSRGRAARGPTLCCALARCGGVRLVQGPAFPATHAVKQNCACWPRKTATTVRTRLLLRVPARALGAAKRAYAQSAGKNSTSSSAKSTAG
jgi:hypothetical protein